MLNEIERLSFQSRRELDVLQRKELVRFLVNKVHLNYSEVARLLERDHSSIMNLYQENV